MVSVLVVDDSVVIRRLIAEALAGDPAITVAGTAANGKIALSKLEQLKPDLVTLDIEMPIMNGVETLIEIRRRHPRLPVIMFSTLTAAGASATLDALAAGASDYVTKPANVGSLAESIRAVREQILPRIHALCAPPRRARPPEAARPGRAAGQGSPARPGMAGTATTGAAGRAGGGPPAAGGQPVGGARTAGGQPADTVRKPARRAPSSRVDAVAIGCSTGGPDALTGMLRDLPADLGVPIFVVQHMPPVFTRLFAERLNRASPLTVVEATAGLVVRPGTVYLAPGDFHLEVLRRGQDVVTRLHTGPAENYCRPSVDVLFRSVAQVYGGGTLAVILTGMGHDGQAGCEALRAVGAGVFAQDELTSVVWGMPGAVVQAGLADEVLPIGDMARQVTARLTRGRRPTLVEVVR